MSDYKFDVLAVNETKLDSTVIDGLVLVTGYHIERNDRKYNCGGGVALYIRNNINYVVRKDIVPPNLEIQAVEISKPKVKPFVIVTWYRPPDSKVELFAEFEQFLEAVDSEEKEILLAGDINIDLAVTSSDHYASSIKFLYNSYQFSQLITDYTRVTNNSMTLIDHFITNEPQNISVSGVIPTAISDHYLVYGVRKFPTFRSKPRNITCRNMKDYDRNVFVQDLRNVPWDLLYISDDPNDMVYTWENLFVEVINIHAPLKKRRIRNKPSPWLTHDIKKMMYHRDYLKRKAVKGGSATTYEAYKKARNSINKL